MATSPAYNIFTVGISVMTKGGFRVPAIAVWPGRIAPGQTTDTISGFQDWLPTFAELTDAQLPAAIDGLSLLPTLTGQDEQPQHDYLYWEFHEQGGKRAIRAGDWKAVQLGMNSAPKPIELYDLSTDPAEEHNIAASHPAVVARLEQLMNTAHTDANGYSFESKR